MKISIILAHPDERSFNHVIARAAADRARANGHEVFFHDLYAMGFDPVLPAGEIPDDARNEALVYFVKRDLLGYPATDKDVILGLDWFREKQGDDGLWPTQYEKPRYRTEKDREKDRENRQWVALAVCRMLKRFNLVS